MPKSPDAFRTISEVADWLGVQAHVLRFWESKFAQVKPVKRAGGRRYYRPADMLLLGGIKKLLHDDGLTIKGVQKLLREHGVSHVADQSQPLDDLTMAVIEGDVADSAAAAAELQEDGPAEAAEPSPDEIEENNISAEAEAATEASESAEDEIEPEPEMGAGAEPDLEAVSEPEEDTVSELEAGPEQQVEAEADPDPAEPELPQADLPPEIEEATSAPAEVEPAEPELALDLPEPEAAPDEPEAAKHAVPDTPEPEDDTPEAATIDAEQADAPEIAAEDPLPSEPVLDEPEPEPEPELANADPDLVSTPEDTPAAEAAAADTEEPAALPSFIRRPLSDQPPADPAGSQDAEPLDALDLGAPAGDRKPKAIEIGPLPLEEEMQAAPAALSALVATKTLSADQKAEIEPLMAQLAQLRDRMAAADKDAAKD